jgi:hypothetical protein
MRMVKTMSPDCGSLRSVWRSTRMKARAAI